MSESEAVLTERSTSNALLAAIAVGFLLGVGALSWCYSLQNRLSGAEHKLTDATQHNAVLAERLENTNARLSATAETLSRNVGSTQQQIESRATAIMAAQRAQSAETARLAQQQQAAETQIGAVSKDVASVKTDVGGVKTDVASPGPTSRTPSRNCSASSATPA
jgi:hypothetical protein